jgi:hypothetical protein
MLTKLFNNLNQLIFFIMKTTLTLSFVQGANKLTLNRFEVDSVRISEVAGTLAHRIVNARANMI